MINKPEEFLNQINESDESYKLRMQELADIKNNSKSLYSVAITFQIGDLIVEHKNYKKFKKTQNRFTFHSGNPDIPVKAHYHVYPPRGKKELYAVNIDGSARHRKNKGIEIPRKEAEELIRLGVDIPSNRILEMIEIENLNNESMYVCYLLFSKNAELFKG